MKDTSDEQEINVIGQGGRSTCSNGPGEFICPV
jgi:hypothetical protein